MILIPQLEEYSNQVAAAIPEIKRVEIAVTEEDLGKLMQDHKAGDNILMLTLVPEHEMDGQQDAAKYENVCGFFFLEKIDYSSLKRPEYIAVFTRTQAVAKKFMDKMIMDKSNGEGLFCGMMAWLQESSFNAGPTKMLNGCNGYYVQITMKTNP
jgi:hypothetical protein